jgi:outer membrane protein assembly factor BamB
MQRIILWTACACLASTSLRAGGPAEALDNWHQWRGPLATGMAPHGNPPIHWDDKTNIRWKTEVPGKGSATPIVWGNQIFLLTAVDTGKAAELAALAKEDSRFEKKTKPPTTYYAFIVLCLDRHTGKVLWQKTATEQVPHEGHHPTHSYAAASPTTDGTYLYASFGSQGIYCYDLAGHLQWQRDLGRMETRYGWGEGISPVVHGDTLIVNWDHEAGSFIVALDARTGKTRWKVERDEPTSWATPLLVDYQGRTQVIVNATKRVRSYDLATGQVLWQCGGQTVNAIPSPVAGNNVVYCMSGYGGSAAYAIPLDAKGDLTDTKKVLWHYGKATPYVPSPLLADDRLYFTQGNNPLLTCLDAKTGAALLDRARLPGLASLYASPVAAADHMYVVGRDGTTLVLKRSPTLEVLATNRLDDPIDASPAIVGKQLFLRGEKFLYCIETQE